MVKMVVSPNKPSRLVGKGRYVVNIQKLQFGTTVHYHRVKPKVVLSSFNLARG